MHTVKTKPEFESVTDDNIDDALDILENDPESQDPLLLELDRLIESYAAVFEGQVQEGEEVSPHVLEYVPEHLIEQAAFDIFLEALHDTMQEMDESD